MSQYLVGDTPSPPPADVFLLFHPSLFLSLCVLHFSYPIPTLVGLVMLVTAAFFFFGLRTFLLWPCYFLMISSDSNTSVSKRRQPVCTDPGTARGFPLAARGRGWNRQSAWCVLCCETHQHERGLTQNRTQHIVHVYGVFSFSFSSSSFISS